MTEAFPAKASTSPDFTLRAATAADVPVLRQLEERIFGGEAWSERSLAAEVSPAAPFLTDVPSASSGGVPRRHALLGLVRDDAVGYAFVRISGDVGEILRVAVDAAHRRRGFGTALVQTLLGCAASAGYARVLLEVSAGNAAAIACYTSRGFSCVHRRHRYYADGSDAILQAVSPAGRRECVPVPLPRW